MTEPLPTLQKLPSLSDFLARARKYGGCGILGFQSYPQLEATYGIQDAAAITGYCSTWVALRANDTPTAKHVSENLGQVEQVEANEGMSYGVNDMRDGVNLSRMQVTRPLVMHTEVTNLPNLMGFLRFGRSLPVVRFEDSFNKVASIADAFEERSTLPIRLTPAGEPDASSAEQAAKPIRPKSVAARKRRAEQSSHEDELPLPQPQESPTDPAPDVEEVSVVPDEPPSDVAGPPSAPPLQLFGKVAGFRLRQHGRHDGDRDEARPA